MQIHAKMLTAFPCTFGIYANTASFGPTQDLPDPYMICGMMSQVWVGTG